MSGKIKIGVAGASGRMGQMLIKSLILDDRFLLSGVLENSGHDWLGLDVGEMTGGKSFGLSVSDDPLEVFSKIQAFYIVIFLIPGNNSNAQADLVISTKMLENMENCETLLRSFFPARKDFPDL